MWKPLGRLRKFERRELTWLLMGFSACVLLLMFIALAGECLEGEFKHAGMIPRQCRRSAEVI